MISLREQEALVASSESFLSVSGSMVKLVTRVPEIFGSEVRFAI